MGRRLSIDGAVPFAEAACLRFPYTSRWDLLTAADGEGEPYLFYLPAGTHTLRLEAVLGELAPIIRQAERRDLQPKPVVPENHHDHLHLGGQIPGL